MAEEASLFREQRSTSSAEKTSERANPRHEETWTTLEGKDEALERLASRVRKRDGEHIQQRVVLTDGAEAL